jgi:hypothetical protein
MKLLFLKNRRRLVVLALACALAGCADKSKVQSEPYLRSLSSGTKQMQEVDWDYSEALNTCELPPRLDLQPGSDLRPYVRLELSRRKVLPIFKRLKDLVAGMNYRDYVVCERYYFGWGGGYNFILIAENISKKGSIAYLGREKDVTEFSSNTEFNSLKKFIKESGIISIPPNLEFIDADGTLFFYIFHFDGKIYQTFCSAPTPYGENREFYTLYERLSELTEN